MEKTDDNSDRFQITELFMAQVDVNRCFYGCIKRLKDKDGNPYVFSRIVMPEGFICARETDQKALGENLDKMCVMVLDKNLHGDAGKSTEIFGTHFFLN
ncbi:MAG: hypothetical protein ABR974_14330 [Bacteroidales bacterium]|jgi:hypothetical protein